MTFRRLATELRLRRLRRAYHRLPAAYQGSLEQMVAAITTGQPLPRVWVGWLDDEPELAGEPDSSLDS